VVDLKELTVMAEDVEVLKGLAEKLLDELADLQSVIDAAILEIRMA
jgi:hypothetical protein